jgi:hypothetical protein
MEAAEARYKAAGIELRAARDDMALSPHAGEDAPSVDRHTDAVREVLASQLALMRIGLVL